MEEGSYLLAFTDLAYYSNELQKDPERNFPVGIGGGLSIRTPFGNLAVILANGRDKGHNFGLKYSKIHLGYISRF